MADDAHIDMELPTPSGQVLPALTCGRQSGVPPLQKGEEWLSQRQQKEDEMITAILALLSRKTAQAYVAAEDARCATDQAA